MATDRFQACTQYDDLTGSVAADRAETRSIEHWLQEQGLVRDGEHVVGVNLSVAQLPASGETLAQVVFLVAPDEANLTVRIPGADEPPTIVVRQIERELRLSEFFRFFKRLELTLSSGGEFEGRTYTHVG